MDRFLALSFYQNISVTTRPLLIFPRQQKPCYYTAAEQPQHKIRQHDSMPMEKSGLILGAVDIGRYDTVEVAPPDDESEGDSALIHAFDIVGSPGDGVRDAGIDAYRAEESS